MRRKMPSPNGFSTNFGKFCQNFGPKIEPKTAGSFDLNLAGMAKLRKNAPNNTVRAESPTKAIFLKNGRYATRSVIFFRPSGLKSTYNMILAPKGAKIYTKLKTGVEFLSISNAVEF